MRPLAAAPSHERPALLTSGVLGQSLPPTQAAQDKRDDLVRVCRLSKRSSLLRCEPVTEVVYADAF